MTPPQDIEYLGLKRIPAAGLTLRSSTDLRGTVEHPLLIILQRVAHQ